MVLLATLESKHGLRTSIQFEEQNLQALARDGRVDTYIVATEDGFSPLGADMAFISDDLGIPESEIRRLANWNRFNNPRVSLVALRSKNRHSLLRGVILAASESSECYKRFAVPFYGHPFRDFYYNVTYEAIAFASENWEAHHLALSHLSGSGHFHEDIATCNAEALAHYCDATPSAAVESFMFIGCCISLEHFAGIAQLNSEAKTSRHRPIVTEIKRHKAYDFVHLAWSHNAQHFVPGETAQNAEQPS